MQSLFEATKYRKSRRSYDGRALGDSDRELLSSLVAQLNEESGLCMKLCAGEGKAFSRIRKTYGMFSGVNNYIILAGPDEPLTAEKLGYYGEKVALAAVSAGLGTCFVGASFDRDVARDFLRENEKMYGVISVGYVSDESAKEKLMRSVIRIGKRTRDDICAVEGEAPDWFYEGLDCALTAPSARNGFPTVFRWDGETVTAGVDDKFTYRLMDLGIAKLHFELGAEGRWEFGNGGRFYKGKREIVL